MRKKGVVILLAIFLSVMLSGCGELIEALSKVGSANEQGGEKKEDKELTAEEVLKKNRDEMDKVKGFAYEANGEMKISGDTGEGFSANLSINIKQNSRVLIDSPDVHHNISFQAMGDSKSWEVYFVDGTFYSNEEGYWTKKSGLSGFDFGSISLIDDPHITLKQLRNESDHKMTHEDGLYVFELEVPQEKSSLFLRGILEGIMEEFSSSDSSAHPIKKKIWLDEKTFLPKKMEQSFEITFPPSGGDSPEKIGITIESTVTDQVDQIDVPSNIMHGAEEE